jgi:hypothetical protein
MNPFCRRILKSCSYFATILIFSSSHIFGAKSFALTQHALKKQKEIMPYIIAGSIKKKQENLFHKQFPPPKCGDAGQ